MEAALFPGIIIQGGGSQYRWPAAADRDRTWKEAPFQSNPIFRGRLWASQPGRRWKWRNVFFIGNLAPFLEADFVSQYTHIASLQCEGVSAFQSSVFFPFLIIVLRGKFLNEERNLLRDREINTLAGAENIKRSSCIASINGSISKEKEREKEDKIDDEGEAAASFIPMFEKKPGTNRIESG